MSTGKKDTEENGKGKMSTSGYNRLLYYHDIPQWIVIIVFSVVAIVALVLASIGINLWYPSDDSAKHSGNIAVCGDITIGCPHKSLAVERTSDVNTGGGPTGNLVSFGDKTEHYTSIRAATAIAFHLTDYYDTVGGLSSLLGEPGLRMLLSPFGLQIATWTVSAMGTFIPSDNRIKDNIETLSTQQAFDILTAIEARTFNFSQEWRAEFGLPNAQIMGFISQEVKGVLPEAVYQAPITVNGTKIPDFLNLKQDYLVPVLWAGLKGAIAQNDALTQSLTLLTQRVAALETANSNNN